jgi:hypothetical protein
MPRDPAQVDDELVALVGDASRAPEAEVRAALAPLAPSEEKALRRALRMVTEELSPAGWADLARGVDLRVAQARELSGYYALQAERDALAAMVGAPDRPAVQSLVPEPPAPRAKGKARPDSGHRTRDTKKTRTPDTGHRKQRAQDLLGLFAYHRDAPLVARALKLSLNELLQELDSLKIRRAAFRLTRGVDADLPRATALPGAPSAGVRKRSRKEEPPPVARPKSERDLQQEELKALLAELGPRRTELAARLGGDGAPLSEQTLLARFRAAGLDRELALRERDLVRALYKKHRGSDSRVADELRLDLAGLRRVIADRGLSRELDGIKARFLREARERKWPRARILLVLDEAAGLRDLGLYDEFLREVDARTRVIWTSLAGKRTALDLLARKLRLERPDALRLQRLLNLR